MDASGTVGKNSISEHVNRPRSAHVIIFRRVIEHGLIFFRRPTSIDSNIIGQNLDGWRQEQKL